MNNLVHFIRDCEITKGWFQGLRDCAEEKVRRLCRIILYYYINVFFIKYFLYL